ncbi:DNA translocase FtsK [uncultured Thermanaerothrix sp.]|uniref:FtsK/SpoIIIE family DNA translocase n=1 Tax=uncultured Thermanaerothrix sp. TaxID=1195149 RepID=UPI0026229E3F|nr:DNA translocase FtsK [uncultured Thermanaerothrix sp.]
MSPQAKTRKPSSRKGRAGERLPRPRGAQPKTRTVSRRKTAAQAPSRSPHLLVRLRSLWKRISPEHKMDALGVFLTLTGLGLFLSLISPQNGTVSQVLLNALRRFLGWGSLAVPFAMMITGIWLILRRIERLPLPSAPRLVGLGLLYWNLLTWLHWLSSNLILVGQGKGGGWLGERTLSLLNDALGPMGTGVVLLAWLGFSLMLITDTSLTVLIQRLSKAWQTAMTKRSGLSLPRHPTSSSSPAPKTDEPLPPEFQPLPGVTPRSPVSAKPRRAHAAEPTTEMAPTASAPPANAEASSSSEPLPPSPWMLPALDQILDPPTPAAAQDNLDHERAKIIEETLASFGAPAHVVDISHGPTVTRFGVEPDFIETRSGRTRVRVSRIVSLADDLALALAAPRIRIQAPVPGKHYVGIEVPNIEISRVALREVIESEAFKRLRSPLRFALGKDVAGRPIAADLAAMPHLLIAGTTGSGKSVCVNAILTCLLLHNTPADLRLVLVDPKRVELTGYNGIPHLLTPVVVDTERVIGALQWLQREMDARYHKFAQVGVRNLQEYNVRHSPPLPYLVAVIDELADLMMLAPDETERSITRLAQLARATGIHLILATQRPSVDVVTGLIKANFPARIAFAVASSIDSRVILDQPGAERLLGRGDMLFQAPDAAAPVRLQGTFVSEAEIQRLVDYWRTAAAQQTVLPSPSASGETAVDLLPPHVPLKQGELWNTEQGDPLLQEAIDLVRREGRASVTMLQRRLRIGYTRAARLIDAMEERGIISPALPNSPIREVLDYGPAAPPAED